MSRGRRVRTGDSWWRRLSRSSRPDREVAPTPPVNVRLVYSDGTEVPVDCLYVGVEAGPDGEGIHRWEVINHRAEMPVEMRMEMLPPRTSVAVASS